MTPNPFRYKPFVIPLTATFLLLLWYYLAGDNAPGLLVPIIMTLFVFLFHGYFQFLKANPQSLKAEYADDIPQWIKIIFYIGYVCSTLLALISIILYIIDHFGIVDF